jgi:hypothetical protein
LASENALYSDYALLLHFWGRDIKTHRKLRYVNNPFTWNLSRVDHINGVLVSVSHQLLGVRPSDHHSVGRGAVVPYVAVLNVDDLPRRVDVGVRRFIDFVVVAAVGNRPLPPVFEIRLVKLEKVAEVVVITAAAESIVAAFRRSFRSRRLARRDLDVLGEDGVDDGVDQRLVEEFVGLGVELAFLGRLSAGPAVARVLLQSVFKTSFRCHTP